MCCARLAGNAGPKKSPKIRRQVTIDGDPAPTSPKTGRSPPPQFSAHVYCSQTAGWIKMALGVEVGLGPSHIVVDGEPAPLPKKGQTPQFLAQLYVAKRLDGSRCH